MSNSSEYKTRCYNYFRKKAGFPARLLRLEKREKSKRMAPPVPDREMTRPQGRSRRAHISRHTHTTGVSRVPSSGCSEPSIFLRQSRLAPCITMDSHLLGNRCWICARCRETRSFVRQLQYKQPCLGYLERREVRRSESVDCSGCYYKYKRKDPVCSKLATMWLPNYTPKHKHVPQAG